MVVGLVRRETVRNPHRRRVLDILFHKCEYTEEMGPVMRRYQEARADGREHMERSPRSAVALGQLPAGLDTRRAAVQLHAPITGLMGDWLFLDRKSGV